MKNFKEIAEKILNGELSGIFKLADNTRIHSSLLSAFCDKFFPYILKGAYYTEYGTHLPFSGVFDIIDFIPDTDMKENELTIEIPEGKIVDWEESKKQNKIVFKDKQLTYRDVCKKLLGSNFYFIGDNGSIVGTTCGFTPNCAKTEHQLECILAKNQLANVAKYLNDGWKPNFSDRLRVFVIYNEDDITLKVDYLNSLYARDMGHTIFKSKERAKQAIKILGEETVKLALEPLGI